MSYMVVGDIHGCLKTFQALIEPYPDRKIVLVGDLIDRGPDSVGVVEYVRRNLDRIDVVQGNHEYMMQETPAHLDTYGQPNPVWLNNGGLFVWRQYLDKGTGWMETFNRHCRWFQSLPYYLIYEDVVNAKGQKLLVSHSVCLNTDFDMQVRNQSIIWGRHFPKQDPFAGEYFNVFGHTPVQLAKQREVESDEPIITDWSANIDTACVFGRRLTGFLFPEMEVVSVPYQG